MAGQGSANTSGMVLVMDFCLAALARLCDNLHGN